MNSWVIYAVGLSQIIVLFWLALPFCLWLSYDTFVSKNRPWCHEHAQFGRRYPPPRHTARLSCLAGCAWVGVLIYQLAASGFATQHLQSGAIAPPIYRLFAGSLVTFTAIYSIHWCLEYLRWARKIPLPAKRSITMEPRSLARIVDPRWAWGAYLLLAAAAAIAAAAFQYGHFGAAAMASGLKAAGAAALIALILSLALVYSVRRKKLPLDGTFGSSYRKSELILWICLLYLLGVACILGLIDTLRGTHLLSPVSILVGLSALVQFSLFYLGRHPWLRWLLPPNTRPAP